MKVLVLTNPIHKDFVSRTIYPYNGYHEALHDIHGFYEEESYPFDGAGNYDIGISFMYKHKVPAEEVNSHPWFNFHPAPLPEYKGRNLCYHAIMNGEREFGASLHYMDENFDTGDIIKVKKFIVKGWATADYLSNMAMALSKDLFAQYFPRIIAGEEFERLPNIGGGYYGKTPIPDVLELRSDGEIGQFVRAVTCGDFYPKVDIGGVTYKIVKDE